MWLATQRSCGAFLPLRPVGPPRQFKNERVEKLHELYLALVNWCRIFCQHFKFRLMPGQRNKRYSGELPVDSILPDSRKCFGRKAQVRCDHVHREPFKEFRIGAFEVPVFFFGRHTYCRKNSFLNSNELRIFQGVNSQFETPAPFSKCLCFWKSNNQQLRIFKHFDIVSGWGEINQTFLIAYPT